MQLTVGARINMDSRFAPGHAEGAIINGRLATLADESQMENSSKQRWLYCK